MKFYYNYSEMDDHKFVSTLANDVIDTIEHYCLNVPNKKSLQEILLKYEAYYIADRDAIRKWYGI